MQHKQDWLGVTNQLTEGVDPVPVYQDDNGIQSFVTDENYLLLDGESLEEPLQVVDAGGPVYIDRFGNAVDAVPLTVVPGESPDPLIPGPLDHVENAEGLDNITVQYDLAHPTAMFGVVFRHSEGVTGITATHGGEPLELIDIVFDEEDNIGAAVFIGNDLKTESADLVVTPVGGTIGPAVMRIDDSFSFTEVDVGVHGTQTGRSYIGAANQPAPFYFNPVNGRGWGVYALAVSSAEQPSYAIGWYGAAPTMVAFGAPASSGTLKDVPDFIPNSTWIQDGDWWQHNDAAYSYLIGEPLPSYVVNPFWYEIEVDVPEGERLYVNTIGSSGGGYLNDMFIGPISGVFRKYRHQTYSAASFRIQANGTARFRNFRYCNDGQTVYGAFGRTVNRVPQDSALQFQIGRLSRFAGIITEVHEGVATGPLNRDSEPLNDDGDDLNRVE